MKICVLGYTNAGKDMASRILAELIGSPPPMACSDVIVPDYAQATGRDVDEVFAHKPMHRVELYEYGKLRQREDARYPAMEILAKTDVLNGIRTRQQYLACTGIFDLIVWIDRPGYGPGETDELRPGHANIRVVNDGTPADLRLKLEAVLDAWGERHG